MGHLRNRRNPAAEVYQRATMAAGLFTRRPVKAATLQSGPPTVKVEVTKVENEGCTVSFPQATDDENVHHYVIELVEKGSDEVLANHGIFSGYYLNSRAPKSFAVRLAGGIPNAENPHSPRQSTRLLQERL